MLLPLPEDSDDDLLNGLTIAKAQGRAPASKVAGVRQKSKGKQRAAPNDVGQREKGKEKAGSRKRKQVDEDEDDDGGAKRGRPKGAGNYTADEVDALLDFVEDELPQGQRGWNTIHRRFTQWARRNDGTERTPKSLETKYKQVFVFNYLLIARLTSLLQLVKQTKPTGNAYCPPDVKRAHKIDALIFERACTQNLNDSDFDDVAEESEESEEDVEVVEPVKKKSRTTTTGKEVHEAVIRRPDPSVQRRPRSNNTDLIGRLADAFDPSVQQARDEGRAQRSFQTSQIFTLTQQLRDANQMNESLRSQLSIVQNGLHEAERARDRAEMELRLMEKMGQVSRGDEQGRMGRATGVRRRSLSTKRTLQRVRGKTRCEETYPEGGSFTYWVTDPSSDSDHYDYDWEMSDKENIAPLASAHRRRHSPSTSSARQHHHLRSQSPLPVAGPSRSVYHHVRTAEPIQVGSTSKAEQSEDVVHKELNNDTPDDMYASEDVTGNQK